ncbi:ABC transporter substrate-binding protein [Gordonia soli]|uniref:heme/hemin ABC transporter substrate-binding protein n=1 Tax=Gordonia soli TaxID=320799 RepID=UPI00058B5AFB
MRPRARLLGLVAGVLALALIGTGCSTAPIEQPGASSAAASHLRDGPSTAELDRPDIVPVTSNPAITLPATVPSVGQPDVTVSDASRIIAVDRNGSLGTIVFSLGLGPKVVGRDTSTAFPAARSLPLVTDRGHTLNAESVLALRPTVVLVDEQTIPPQAVDQIRASDIPVVEFSSKRTIATTPALIRSVAAALGVRPAGDALAQRTLGEIDAAKKQVPSPSGDPTIAFVYIRGPRLTLLAGPNSGADDLIAALGGRDAGTAAGLSGAFTAISAEAMVRADPDVLLVMTEGAESVGGIDGVLALPGIAETQAGRHRRVVQMDQTEVLAFGPDVGLVLGALARSIYT